MEVFLHKEDMPNNCFACSFTDEYFYCFIMGENVKDDGHNVMKSRHSSCPLKSLNERELP